jgi:nucleoside-diphosphate-sugar epimerase
MRHLVTGGSGFLGSLIAKRLYQQGEQVKVLDIWDDPTRPEGIEFINCDIRDRDGVAQAMGGVEVVHHNVALVPLTKSGDKFWEVNVTGSRIAAEEAVKAGVDAFVHMSSSAVYGTPETQPITNGTPTVPVEIYGRAKLAGEQAVREVSEQANLSLIVVRPRTILGTGRFGIFQILFDWIRDGRNVYVIGSGDIEFQFVHADDLMDFYMLALDKGAAGVYNVGTDQFGTLRADLEKLIAHAGTASKVKSLPAGLSINGLKLLDRLNLSPLAPWHYLTYHKPFHFDVAPLIELGWDPQYSNDRMFQESYDWFLEHYDQLVAGEAASAHRRPVRQKILWLVKRLS